MAWQRHLNGSGKYAVDDLLNSLGHQEIDPDDLPPMLVDRELEPVFEEISSVAVAPNSSTTSVKSWTAIGSGAVGSTLGSRPGCRER